MPDDNGPNGGSVESGSTGDYGGSGSGFGGGDPGFGGGGGYGVGAALDVGNMSTGLADIAALGGLALGAGLVGGGYTGTVAGGLAAAAGLAGSLGNPAGAVVDISHDMAVGLGVAMSANPSMSVFETASVGITDPIGGGGSYDPFALIDPTYVYGGTGGGT